MYDMIFRVNNGRMITVEQDHIDGEIVVTTLASDGTTERTENISAGDFVLLLNYYHHQKEQGKEIF